MHGRIDFDLQRYHGRESGYSYTYFSLTDQFSEGYISLGLQELSAYYANRLSYRGVSGLLERISGEGQLSFTKVEDIVIRKALEISHSQYEVAQLLLESSPLPELGCDFDLYDESTKEVLVFEDGILVKKQKESRCKENCETEDSDSSKRVNTDVIVLEQNNGNFRYITAGINGSGEQRLSLEDAVKFELIREYANAKVPLNIVVISDGARSIRKRMIRIFGENVCIILDWYHLNKKLRDLMSMIAINKKVKIDHLINIRGLLWEGKVEQTLDYLDSIRSKNGQKLNELRTYLNKHKSEIVNYEQRKAANKCIGSGRVEKAVDLVIGNRQKKKGMSWSDLGSKSLGILKVAELNDEWEKIWNSQKWAA